MSSTGNTGAMTFQIGKGLIPAIGNAVRDFAPPENLSPNISAALASHAERCAFHTIRTGIAEHLTSWLGMPCCIPCYRKKLAKQERKAGRM